MDPPAGSSGNSEATLRLHYDDRNDSDKRRAIGALELWIEMPSGGPPGR